MTLNELISKVKYGDKIAHFIGGFVVSFLCMALGLHPTDASNVATWVGIGKEVYDYFHPETHTSDIWDCVATGAGGATASVLRLFGAL